jgi:hypothetical protein
VNFSTQTHDFDPGFAPPVNANGDRLFWTAAIPDSAVSVNFGAGRAEMHVRDLEMEDYFNFPNASADGPEVDGTVSFDVVWNGPVTRRVSVRDVANNFAGSYVENQATITWSGSNEPGFSFTSNPGNFSTSVPEGGPFAELGHERNGSFFGDDDSFGARMISSRGGAQHKTLSAQPLRGEILAHHPGRGGGSAVDGTVAALLAHAGSAANAAQDGVKGGTTSQDQLRRQGSQAVPLASDAAFVTSPGEENAAWSLGHGWAAPRPGRR